LSPCTYQPSVKAMSSRGTIATCISGRPSLIQRTSPFSIGMNPAAMYSECPVPEPKLHDPLNR